MSPRPKRGDTWICSVCGAENEPARVRCMNGCGNGLCGAAVAEPDPATERRGA